VVRNKKTCKFPIFVFNYKRFWLKIRNNNQLHGLLTAGWSMGTNQRESPESFEELRHLEKSEYREDPKEWKQGIIMDVGAIES
jgi:hypothetical protein